MFTQRLDPAGGGSGGALRLAPLEERLFVEMVPSLRSVAMGKKAGGSVSTTDEDEAMEAGLEEVRALEHFPQRFRICEQSAYRIVFRFLCGYYKVSP